MPKGPTQQEIVRLLMDLSRSLTNHYDAKLAELHLTLPQAMLLRQLGDALPMNEAAGKLHCDPSNVTGIVDRLEARGLIERQHLTKDRRFFFFNDTATTEIYTLSLHDALPI